MMRSCPECEEPMKAELLSPDPHEPPIYTLLCPCGHSEPATPDVIGHLEDHPRMPGF